MLTATPWYYLPQFRPARLQDCVLWLESDSFHGGIWRNLIPNSANTSHGTAHGGVGLSTWHPQFAPALEFYAGDDYVDLPLDIVFDDEMSIEILFELYDDTDRGRAIGSQHSSGCNYEFRTWTGGNKSFYLYVGDGSDAYPVMFYLDDWYNKTHVVWMWKYDGDTDQTTLKAYKNGVFKDSNMFNGKAQLPNLALRLGRWNDQGMNGKIYLARFYHKVLSDDEISDLANGYGLTTLSYPNHVLVSKYVTPAPVVIV